MATFPTISREPEAKGFSELIDPEAMSIAKATSGLPVLNKLFTFAPKTFRHTRYFVAQADKETVMTFYGANKDVPFDWLNTQDSNTYEVIFLGPPKVSLDKINKRWMMVFIFKQYSPLP